MSGLPRKVKKALEKWVSGVPMGSREHKRLRTLFSRTGLAPQAARTLSLARERRV